MNDSPIIAENLVRHFGDVHAVKGINLEVKAGEVFGFLGPNGAGKSTAVRMLTTLLRPTSGTARVAGFDVVKQADQVRRSIGVALGALGAAAQVVWLAWWGAHLPANPVAQPKNDACFMWH